MGKADEITGMDLTLSPEYTAFRDHVAKLLEENAHLAPGPEDKGLKHPKRLAWQKFLIGEGLTARAIPTEYGGYGAEPDILKSRIIAEEFARSGVPRPLAGQGISMLVPTLLELGTPEQKEKYIRPTLYGEMIWCQGYSEPGAGSDLASLQTKAVEDGDEYVINGQKIWTSTARQADMIFCLVRTDPEAKKHHGITYILFPMNTPGIEVRPLVDMTGSANFNEVFFTDVRVPKSGVVFEPNKGWQVANATLTHERGMLGDPNATKARFVELVELMKRETVNGERLIDNPLLRDRLMALQAEVYAMQANGLRTMTSRLKKESAGLAGLVVKLQGCELNHQIAGLAIDALGELGVLYGDGEHLRSDGSWQWRYMYDLGLIIGGGTAQIQKNIIAERGLDMPREPKLAVRA
ncbi:acyl-CoA dehydrogenase [Hyphomonas pacifica]|uniref:Acyl-CoA dehydrogenase n=2 Tax=Hyphomonas pacifica TaxID=1280941 RepID=A0A062U2E8_9PROT|nr:acyl-CoA dehydrogenase [Hyphomonas pacifica]RAN32593.1 acyl-CoA dehydrogenase [Hyphomonas pacifica]